MANFSIDADNDIVVSAYFTGVVAISDTSLEGLDGGIHGNWAKGNLDIYFEYDIEWWYLDGAMGGMEVSGQIVQPTWTIAGNLPILMFEGNLGWGLDGELPAMEGGGNIDIAVAFDVDVVFPDFNIDGNIYVEPSFELVGFLPTLAVDSTFGWNLDAVITALESSGEILTAVELESLDGELPELEGSGTINVEEVFVIDGEFPPLHGVSNTLYLDGILPVPTMTGNLVEDVESNRDIAYVLNIETEALTEYANYGFTSRMLQVKGVTYGIKGGYLYRITGTTDDTDGVAAPTEIEGSVLTHLDNRVLNRVQELVRNDQLKRCYAVYINAQADKDFVVEVIADQDYNDRYIVSIDDKVTENVYRVDTYRGILGHYWGVRIRNIYGGNIQVNGIALVLEPVEAKIWR